MALASPGVGNINIQNANLVISAHSHGPVSAKGHICEKQAIDLAMTNLNNYVHSVKELKANIFGFECVSTVSA